MGNTFKTRWEAAISKISTNLPIFSARKSKLDVMREGAEVILKARSDRLIEVSRLIKEEHYDENEIELSREHTLLLLDIDKQHTVIDVNGEAVMVTLVASERIYPGPKLLHQYRCSFWRDLDDDSNDFSVDSTLISITTDFSSI